MEKTEKWKHPLPSTEVAAVSVSGALPAKEASVEIAGLEAILPDEEFAELASLEQFLHFTEEIVKDAQPPCGEVKFGHAIHFVAQFLEKWPQQRLQSLRLYPPEILPPSDRVEGLLARGFIER